MTPSESDLLYELTGYEPSLLPDTIPAPPPVYTDPIYDYLMWLEGRADAAARLACDLFDVPTLAIRYVNRYELLSYRADLLRSTWIHPTEAINVKEQDHETFNYRRFL